MSPRSAAPPLASLALGIALAAAAAAQEGPEGGDPHRRRSTLYVAVRGTAEVIALSRDRGERIAAIPVGRLPSGLAARADGDRIYVACAGSHSVVVIDGATRRVLDTVALVHGASPAHLVLSPDDAALYVAASGLDAVLVLDAASLQQTAEIPVGREPRRLALSRDGRRLHVLCAGSGRVDIIDTLAARVLTSAPVGSQPSDIALDPSTGTAYVVRSGAPALHAIPEGANRAREIALDAPGVALAMDRAARRLAIASPAAGRIDLVSPATGASSRAIRASEVSRLVVDPEGSRLYALSARRGVLLFVDRILGAVEREVEVGKEPWDLVLIP
jgi:YVTN family beta-propeller protein